MKIHIATPPWLSWYAYCIYSILFLAVLWLVMRTLYIMTKLRAETRMEQHMSEMKIRFFTNISHELRTPLTLIIGGLEDLQNGKHCQKRTRQFRNVIQEFQTDVIFNKPITRLP